MITVEDINEVIRLAQLYYKIGANREIKNGEFILHDNEHRANWILENFNKK